MVENIIEKMVRERESVYKGTSVCNGRERMNMGTDRRCAHMFSIKAHIDYFPDAGVLPSRK
jgi:hypothetical protein